MASDIVVRLRMKCQHPWKNLRLLLAPRLILHQSWKKRRCKLYSNEPITDDPNVDLVRMRVFCQRTRDVERSPPTSDALDQHIKRSVYQASIWTTAHQPMMPVENPRNHGWMEKNGNLIPIWTTLPLAKDVFKLDVKCSCTKPCSSCKCKKANLTCTRLYMHTSVQVQMYTTFVKNSDNWKMH